MTPKSLITAIAVIFLAFGALASAESIQVTPADLTIAPGGTGEVSFILDSAPAGVAGYVMVVTLANPSVADITGVSFPAWGALNNVTQLPSDSVRLSAVDLEKSVETGATLVPLATITIRGQNAGISDISITSIQLTADGGAGIEPSLGISRVTTSGSSSGTGGGGGGGGSVSSSTAQQTTTVTRTVTAVTTAPIAISTTAAAETVTQVPPVNRTLAPDTTATTAPVPVLTETEGESQVFTIAIAGIIVLVILTAVAVVLWKRKEKMP